MKGKLIFLVTEDWYFHMHRLPQALAAQAAGYDVAVATRVRAHRQAIEDEGFQVLPLGWRRGSLNPVMAIWDIIEIARIYAREEPVLVHHVSLKSIVLGTIAARLAGVRAVVNAYTGLGTLFESRSPRMAALRLLLLPMMRRILEWPRAYTIAENKDHLDRLIAERLAMPGRSRVIQGSGIDTDRFQPMRPPPEPPVVLGCAARMLHSKGILVLEAAMTLLARESVRLLLAGEPDPENAESLSDGDMQRIAALTNVEWLGRIPDVRELWKRAHIGILPSINGEGVPVSLLEAAACGRPLIATNVAGCREIVRDGVNGMLVPPGDAMRLANAIAKLAKDSELRRIYGDASRQMVEGEMSAREVGRQTVTLYASLTKGRHA